MSVPCREIRELLPLYVGRDLSGPSRETVSTHLGACTPCRDEAEKTARALRSLRQYDPALPESEFGRFFLELRGRCRGLVPHRQDRTARTASVGRRALSMVRANRGLAAAVCLAFTLGLLASGDLLVGSNKASGPAVSSPWAGGVNERPVVRSVPSRLFSPVGLGPPPAYRVGQPPSSSLPENVNPHDGPAVKPRYELIESQKAIAIPARLRGEPY